MKYTKKIEKSISTIEITFTNAEIEEFKQLAYEKEKGKFRIEGFRQGKAPRAFIEKAYGADAFLETAITMAISKHYYDIIEKEKDLEILTQPELEFKNATKDKIVIACIAPVMPKVELGEYKNLTIEKTVKSVSDADVLVEIKQTQETMSRMVEVTDRSAKMNDIANINFEGKIDGVPFDGGKAEGYDLTLGSHSFIDTFEDQIVGMNIGETKDINVTFPENYHSEELKGKPAVFTVKLNALKEKQLPELNDEFASNVSEFETLKEYKANVKKSLIEKNEKAAEMEVEDKLVEMITESSKMDIPEILILDQIERDIQKFNYDLSRQGINIETYAQMFGTTLEEIKNQRKPFAEKQVRSQLVIREIVEKENIRPTDEEMDKELQEKAEKIGMSLEDYKKTIIPETLNSIATNLIIQKLMKFLKENNNIVTK